MINPTEKDIGRGVIYQASYPNAPREDGVIVRVTEHSVFVRYKGQHPGASGQGTNREDLEWALKRKED